MADPIYTGTIKRLVSDRGFGFIEIDGDGGEVFFHRSATTPNGALRGFDAMREGQRVTFDTEPGPKGLRAINVSQQTTAR